MTDYAKAVLGFLGLGLLCLLILVFAISDAFGQVIPWRDASGKPLNVVVMQGDCPDAPGRGCYYATVYIGGNAKRLPHELAHVAGMRHTNWMRNGFGTECAVVTDGGHDTGYRTGDTICAGFDGDDVIWRK